MATGVRSSLAGGTWIGVKGLSIKEQGLPYGCVFLLDNGSVVAYFALRDFFEQSEMSGQRLVVYWVVTGAALLIGVPLGIAALAAS